MPSTVTSSPTPSQLLELFVHAYNLEVEATENLQDQFNDSDTLVALTLKANKHLKINLENSNEKIEVLEAKLDQSYIESDQVLEENKKLKSYCKQFDIDLDAKNEQIKLLESALKEKDKEIVELNNGLNPTRLKKQLANSKKKRLASLNAIKEVRKTRNEAYATANDFSLQLKTSNNRVVQLELALLEQKKQLDHSTGAFIFNSGPHFLLKWEENCQFETHDKRSYKVKTAMYFHESGRMALMSIDPTTGKAGICRAPVGGIRPNRALVDAAYKYLTAEDATNEVK